MPDKLTDDKSTLVQVLAWCRQATSHCLSQGWLSSLSPCRVTRLQWVKGHIDVYCLGVTSWHNTLHFYVQGLRPHTTTTVLIFLIADSQIMFSVMVICGLRYVLEKQWWALLILGVSNLGVLGSVSSLALYQPSTTSPSYQVMGTMIFDKVSICWKNFTYATVIFL